MSGRRAKALRKFTHRYRNRAVERTEEPLARRVTAAIERMDRANGVVGGCLPRIVRREWLRMRAPALGPMRPLPQGRAAWRKRKKGERP